RQDSLQNLLLVKSCRCVPFPHLKRMLLYERLRKICQLSVLKLANLVELILGLLADLLFPKLNAKQNLLRFHQQDESEKDSVSHVKKPNVLQVRESDHLPLQQQNHVCTQM